VEHQLPQSKGRSASENSVTGSRPLGSCSRAAG
jgi:hypothetical protein